METLQIDNPKDLWEHLLYLSAERTYRKQLAYWTHVGKGKPRGVSKVRPKGTKATVLQLQHKQGRNGRRLLQKDVKRNRGGKDVIVRK